MFFWIAFVISVATFLTVVSLLSLHYIKWFPEYNDIATRGQKNKFDRTKWRNTECNQYFHENFKQSLEAFRE